MKNLSNPPPYRAAFVSGGTRGIGRETVLALAKSGYRVGFCYRQSKSLADELVQEASQEGLAVHGFLCDVSNPQELDALYKTTKNVLGSIDTLVCNAGAAHKSLVADETSASINKTLDTNLGGTIHLARLYVPDMVRMEFGRIINVSSIFARTGASMEAVYAAAKGGVEAFTKSLASELGASGITANVVAPGLIDTRMNGGLSSAERAQFLEHVAVGRMGMPKEVADLIVFLASEKASYITGQVIGIDGGFF